MPSSPIRSSLRTPALSRFRERWTSVLVAGAFATWTFAGAAAPALAQPGWGPPPRMGGWDHPERESSHNDPREGKVSATRFFAPDAGGKLGKGRIAVVAAPGGTLDSRGEATFEAAVIDQLAKAGYDTATAEPNGGQVVELRVITDVLVPEEEKHSPVSGSAAMGVSNRGSMMALEVDYDASKPRKALVSTTIELTIRERGSTTRLWEGRAQIATREGDAHWSQQAVAARLAGALFEGFPAGGAQASARAD